MHFNEAANFLCFPSFLRWKDITLIIGIRLKLGGGQVRVGNTWAESLCQGLCTELASQGWGGDTQMVSPSVSPQYGL